MEISPAAKVGIVTALAVIILGMTIAFLGAGQQQTAIRGTPYHIIFDKVEGITVGTPVRMAGVQIGKVRGLEILPNFKVKVTIDVDNIPGQAARRLTNTSEITIGQSFVGEKWVDIQPRAGDPVPPGGELTGKAPVSMDELIAKAEVTLTKVNTAMEGLEFVNDPEFQDGIKDTVANFKALSDDFRGTAKQLSTMLGRVDKRIDSMANQMDRLLGQVNNSVGAISAEIQSMAGNLNAASLDLRGLASRNSREIDVIVGNVKAMTRSLRGSMAALERLANNKQLTDDMLKTVANIRKTTEEIEGITSDIRLISSDPKVQGNIKAAVEEAKNTAAEARNMIQKINKILDGFQRGTGGNKLYQLDLESEWNLKTGDQDTNINAWILPRGFGLINYGLRAGIDDIGGQNLANLQAAMPGEKYRPRAGVYRSQVGVGIDRFMGQHSELSFDLYDTSNPKVDILGRFGNKDLYIMGGFRDVLRDDRRETVVGVGKKF